jgi:hypothetical protein
MRSRIARLRSRFAPRRARVFCPIFVDIFRTAIWAPTVRITYTFFGHENTTDVQRTRFDVDRSPRFWTLFGPYAPGRRGICRGVANDEGPMPVQPDRRDPPGYPAPLYAQARAAARRGCSSSATTSGLKWRPRLQRVLSASRENNFYCPGRQFPTSRLLTRVTISASGERRVFRPKPTLR